MYLGLDLGFNRIKLVTPFSQHAYTSAIGNPSSFELEHTPTMILEDNLSVTFDDTTYYIGKKAMNTNNARLCIDTDKTNSTNDRVALYSALGISAEVTKEQTFNIVTGLPVEDFKKSGLREELISNLKGTHKFIFKGESVVTHVENVLVIPQAAGAFYDYILNDNGEIKLECMDILNGTVMVIDIGYKTTDVITMSYGEYVSDQSCTIPKGMKDIHKELARYINSKYDRSFNLASMDGICRAGGFIHKGNIVDITNVILELEKPITEFIINETNALIGDTKGANLIIGCGGTMSVMDRYFSLYYGDYFVTNNIEFANASGDYKYGLLYETLH